LPNSALLSQQLFSQQLFNGPPHLLFTITALPIQLTLPPASEKSLPVDQVDGGPHGIAPIFPIRRFKIQ
jgi:hypothetical protein